MNRLTMDPPQALTLLERRLQPVPGPDERKVARQVARLDSADFAVRHEANAALERLGDLARPALTKLLAGKSALELRQRAEQLLDRLQRPVTDVELLRTLRAIEIIERAEDPLGSSAPQTR